MQGQVVATGQGLRALPFSRSLFLTSWWPGTILSSKLKSKSRFYFVLLYILQLHTKYASVCNAYVYTQYTPHYMSLVNTSLELHKLVHSSLLYIEALCVDLYKNTSYTQRASDMHSVSRSAGVRFSTSVMRGGGYAHNTGAMSIL